MHHTPGHSVGHIAATVATTMGDIVVADDAIFQERDMEPNPAEGWRYRAPARFVDSVAGWRSVEELDKRADVIPPCHDRIANARSDVFPYEGMKLRKRRHVIPGVQFYFGDMPAAAVGRAAAAMKPEDVEVYLAALTPPTTDPA
ncbi:hypothetical protein [Rubrimonas sp.]|uniref:hypothetical protein n=1 Tax=Rubrimonas sp. TaxID=2036015 RepID=UPI002FDE2EA3